MRKIVLALLIIVSSLLICGAFVILFKDRTILVPPPEQASESFFKQVQMKRYSRAIPLLSSELERKVTPELLIQLKREVEARVGTIEKVQGKESIINGNSATSVAEVQGTEGSINISVTLVREQGVWKVDSVMLNVH
jgi:hypothetical protein